MEYSLAPMSEQDRRPIMDIFNHYVEHSFAAYPENRLPYEAFDMFLQMTKGFPAATVRNGDGKIIGFGMLRAHHPMPAFAHTAEITYFIDPAYTGQGIGTRLLQHLAQQGALKGIIQILANISSLNPGSIDFHKKNGFVECGRFKAVGRKKGRFFDTVWMQKTL